MSTTPTTQITGEMVIEAVRAIADEHPDFVYNPDQIPGKTCYYRDEATGEPDCIIGRALDVLGVLPKVLGLDNTVSVRILLDSRGNKALVKELSHNQLSWLTRVQSYQDSGSTWLAAVTAADRATRV